MIDPKIQAVSSLQPGRVEATQPLPSRPVSTGKPDGSFKSALTDAISEVQRLQTEADTTIKKLVSGEIKDVSETMVAVERADVSFQTMMAVRNKILAAYDEVMRMQV